MGAAPTQAEFDALLRDHHAWNDHGTGRRLVLSGRALTGLRLDGLRLDGARLDGADLSVRPSGRTRRRRCAARSAVA